MSFTGTNLTATTISTTVNATTLWTGVPCTTSHTTTAILDLRQPPEDDGLAGVGEPRRPLPSAPGNQATRRV